MAADFERAVAYVLRHEGGLADHPKDPGGITNHGISLRFLRKLGSLALGDVDGDGDIDPDDIRAMSKDRAKAIYRNQWWDRYRYGLLRQRTATKIFDHAVNLGPFVAHKLVQDALVDVGVAVEVDGRLGDFTRAGLNAAPEGVLIETYKSLLEAHYRNLARLRPEFRAFINGWVRRARSG